MTQTLMLPRLGETMETGRVVAWQKEPGQSFRRGETIVEIESDKTVVEMPALASGRLIEILAEVGVDIEVGAPLCRFEPEEAAIPSPVAVDTPPGSIPPVRSSELSEAPTDRVASMKRPHHVDGRAEAESAVRGSGTSRVRATPTARKLARERGIDLADVKGTGRRQRIDVRDIVATASGANLTQTPDRIAPAQVDADVQYVRVGSGAIAYREWRPRSAPASAVAVMLHGFAGDSQTWSTLAALLVQGGTRVIALDLPAHGETSLEAKTVDELIAPVVAFLTSDVVAGPVQLVGHSLGGAIAVAVARKVPQAVASVTLIAPIGLAGTMDGEFVASMSHVRSGGDLSHLLRRLALRPPALSSVALASMAARLGAGRLTALSGAVVLEGRQQIDIISELAALALPVRVVWGLDDRIVPWTHVAAVPASVPIHLIASAGHMPQWDQPQRLADLFAAST